MLSVQGQQTILTPASSTFPTSPHPFRGRSKGHRQKTTNARDKSFSRGPRGPRLRSSRVGISISRRGLAALEAAQSRRHMRKPARAGTKRGLLPFPAPREAAPPLVRAAERRRRPLQGAGARALVWPGAPCPAPQPQRGEQVLNKCLWRRRGRRMPSARALALMHRTPLSEEAALTFAAAPGAAARVRATRGRISHAHAAAAAAAAASEQQALHHARYAPLPQPGPA